MTWIKTTDQLPPVGCYVLGYVILGRPHFAFVKRHEEYPILETTFGNIYSRGAVTHWTHLPNAPEVEG